jgi:hypothetical protein
VVERQRQDIERRAATLLDAEDAVVTEENEEKEEDEEGGEVCEDGDIELNLR